MRKELCDSLLARIGDPDMIFLTGDLGFMALEPLQEALGTRFINAGVAEQNMISVSAALAKDGWQPWCYSIAPFCYARPFEQIRNDICMHNLAVKLLGNGGGFGYGVAGTTHHALEDYGILLTLPAMKVYVPCFDEDVAAVIESAAVTPLPCYIRLGRGELPAGETAPQYQAWRRLIVGEGAVVVCAGPIAGSAWQNLRDLPAAKRPDLWILSEFPLAAESLPAPLTARLAAGAHLITVEEHSSHGGLAAMLSQRLMLDGVPVKHFTSLNASALPARVYGSQKYLRNHSGMAPEDIRRAVLS